MFAKYVEECATLGVVTIHISVRMPFSFHVFYLLHFLIIEFIYNKETVITTRNS